MYVCKRSANMSLFQNRNPMDKAKQAPCIANTTNTS